MSRETTTRPRPAATGVAASVFVGESEMARRCREFDWSSTSLGPVEGWSHSLRTTVSTLLMSRNPMFLWWGPDLIQIYNDDYRPSFGGGGRHPRALGAKGKEFWTDIWDAIGPQIDFVMSGKGATWHEDQYIPIERNGRMEDVWWTYSYSPVRDDDGSIGGLLVVCQETTKRVLGEQQLKSLLSELSVARTRLEDVFRLAPSFLAVIAGPDLVFELVNEAYYQLVGHRELIGKPLWEAVPEARGHGFEELLDGVLATGQPVVARDLRIPLARTRGAPPEERFIDLTYMPLLDAAGRRVGVIAHGTDVTDQVRARHEVERLLHESERARADAEAARVEAEEANRAKAEFLRAMSHELRTPLNAIGGYVELIEMGIHGPVTEAQRVALGRVSTSQRHLLTLINDILVHARMEAGHIEFDLQPLPATRLLSGVEPLVAPMAEARGISCRVTDCDGTVDVLADEERVRQVLLNLLSNAIKFTHPDGRIEVDAAPRDGGVAIRVHDTGIGIAADQLEQVFEPFVQITRDLASGHEGTGLGLAISRDLARLMGGDLTAESEPGVGSTFTLLLKG